jgi:hypothetical protein
MTYAFPNPRSGVRYEIRWRRLTEILAMSASLAGVVAFVFWGV